MHSVYNYSGFVDLIADPRALSAQSENGNAHASVSSPGCPEQPAIEKKLHKTPLPDKPEG